MLPPPLPLLLPVLLLPVLLLLLLGEDSAAARTKKRATASSLSRTWALFSPPTCAALPAVPPLEATAGAPAGLPSAPPLSRLSSDANSARAVSSALQKAKYPTVPPLGLSAPNTVSLAMAGATPWEA